MSGWKIRRQELGQRLLAGLYAAGLFRTWLRDKPEGWELVSGLWSPFYIQARHLPSHPELLSLAATGLAELLRNELPEVNRLVGVATTGIPLAAVAALQAGLPMAYTRKLPGVRTPELLAASDYGEHALIEGDLATGDRIALIDDVVAQFTSKEVAIHQVSIEAARRNLADVAVFGVVVLVDREQGAAASGSASRLGVRIASLVRLRTEGLSLLREVLSPRECEVLGSYLNAPEELQKPEIIEALVAEARAAHLTHADKEESLHVNDSVST